MARSKHPTHDDTAALAAFCARRVAYTVPSTSTYEPAIADAIASALADAAAGRTDPVDAATESRALDTD